jgi:hypothetical protein
MLENYPKPDWLSDKNIRPYVFVRQENRVLQPGSLHEFPWFKHNFILKDPLKMKESYFGHAIMNLDAMAFGKQQMVTPPWVFYDCGVLPGIITGFAARTESLPIKLRKKLKADPAEEWTPISLFIVIPTVQAGTWMAHNLASVNSILEKKEQYKYLGFLTKAYGLWYANIERLYGVTQWHSPALRLHPNFGEFQLITTFTPLHDYANSVTYCCLVDSGIWPQIIDKKLSDRKFSNKYRSIGTLDSQDEKALKKLQKRLEDDKEKIYLSGLEILNKEMGEPIHLYKKKTVKQAVKTAKK